MNNSEEKSEEKKMTTLLNDRSAWSDSSSDISNVSIATIYTETCIEGLPHNGSLIINTELKYNI